MVDRRLPAHIAVLLGASVGAYAVSLACVTALQANWDASVRADRAPARRAADAISADHDALETTVEAAARRYVTLIERYSRIGGSMTGMQESLGVLAERAATLSETAASLPTRVSLPAVRSAPARVAPPRTQATTRASG